MSRISAIGIKNFRTFKEMTRFEFKEKTFVVGPNNSGKSSLSLFLQLIQQSFEKHAFGRFDTDDLEPILGDWDNILNEKDKPLEFYVDIEDFNYSFTPTDFVMSVNDRDNFKSIIEDLNLKYYRDFDQYSSFAAISKSKYLKSDIDNNSEKSSSVILPLKIILRIQLSFVNKKLNKLKISAAGEILCEFVTISKVTKININTYNILNLFENRMIKNDDCSLNSDWIDFKRRYEDKNIEVIKILCSHIDLNYLIEKLFFVSDDDFLHERAGFLFHVSSIFNFNFDEPIFFNALTGEASKMKEETWAPFYFIKKIDYLHDLDTNARNNFNEISEVFHRFDEEIFIKYLFVSIKNTLNSYNNKNDYPYDEFLWYKNIGKTDRSRYVNERNYYVKTIEKRMEDLESFVGKFNYDKIDTSIGKIVNDKGINIFDMGNGVDSVFKIILNEDGYECNLILEEPETHLHPKWQSLLAEYLLKSSATLLIETHSEYMIRKAQVMVAKGEVKPEDVGIIYLGEDPNALDYVRHIDILPNGRLSQDFGPGFFDESTKLLVELMQYGGLN